MAFLFSERGIITKAKVEDGFRLNLAVVVCPWLLQLHQFLPFRAGVVSSIQLKFYLGAATLALELSFQSEVFLRLFDHVLLSRLISKDGIFETCIKEVLVLQFRVGDSVFVQATAACFEYTYPICGELVQVGR